MVEVRIPNNIAEYKPKFMFGLSFREFVCAAIVVACVALDLKFLRPHLGDLALVLLFIPAAPAVCFGFIKPYGMTFEKFLHAVLFESVLAPKYRRARTADSTVVPCDKYYVPIPDEAVNPEVLECVVRVRKALGVAQEEQAGKKRGKRKNVKPKYKKSKQAYV